MPQTVEQVLNQAALYSDDTLYRFVGLPRAAVTVAASIVAEIGDPFVALLADKDEVTLMLKEEDFQRFQKRLLDYQISETLYRLITFDQILEPDLIGFIAAISRALADNKISVLPFAAYSRDHIFVMEADFERALSVLNQLKGT